MQNELKIVRCSKCGALFRVIDSGAGSLMCCGEKMTVLKPNTTDAAFEKHVPMIEKVGDEIVVKVNHVMEEEHLINWIWFVADKEEKLVKLEANEIAEAIFKYIPGATVYAYCNKHGFWSATVE